MGRPKTVDSESIKNDFITSSCTLGELANRNNVSYSLVTKLASKASALIAGRTPLGYYTAML